MFYAVIVAGTSILVQLDIRKFFFSECNWYLEQSARGPIITM